MIKILCEGRAIEGFSSVSVNLSLQNFCATYSMSNFKSGEVESNDSLWIESFPGERVQIYCDDELVIEGYNDKQNPRFNSSDFGSSVSGREVTQDAVDGVPSQLNFENKKVDEICRLICNEFGLHFDGAGGADVGAPFKSFCAEPGANAYEVMMNACRERQVMLVSDGCGHVRILNGNYGYSDVDLVQGVNISSAAPIFDFSKRFHSYTVKSAKDPKGQVSATVTDDAVRASRNWLLVDERFATKESCERRAQWEAKKRIADSNKFNVTVEGWRKKDGGELWKPGEIVTCDVPSILGAPRQYLIDSVAFNYSGDGASAAMVLVDPDIYTAPPSFPSAKKKVGKAQKTDPWASVRKQTGSKLK